MLGGPYAQIDARVEAWTDEIDALIATSGFPTRYRTSLRFRARSAFGLGVPFKAVTSEEAADRLDANLKVLRSMVKRVSASSAQDVTEAV